MCAAAIMSEVSVEMSLLASECQHRNEFLSPVKS